MTGKFTEAEPPDDLIVRCKHCGLPMEPRLVSVGKQNPVDPIRYWRFYHVYGGTTNCESARNMAKRLEEA